MNLIYKSLSRTYVYISLFFVILFSNDVKASSAYVIFPYEGYRNAANMDLVENFNAHVMGSLIFFKNKYNGTQAGSALRSSKGNKNFITPMGDIQWRAMPKLVLGLFVYDPVLSLLQYKSGNQAGTKGILNAKSYSPKISYQVLDNLTLGVGIDFMHLSKAILAIPGIAGGTLVAKGDSFKTSFNVGALFKAQPTTLISASYHKGVNFKPKGSVSLNGQTNKGYLNTPLIPDIYSANLTQILTPEWLVSVTARFLNWKPFKNVTIYNAPVVGNLVLPQKYHSAGYGQLLTRYQFSEQWAGILAGSYYTNPMPLKYRPAGLPSAASWEAAAAGQFMPTKNTVITLTYIHAASNAKIANAFSRGTSKIRVNIVELGLTYKY